MLLYIIMRLHGLTKSDTSVIFSLIQDSITCFKWMYFSRKSFSCLLNRYAWEKNQCLRVQSLLTIKNVNNIFESIPTKFKFFYLEFAEQNKDNLLEMKFSNNNYLTIAVDSLDIYIENTSDYYETLFRPYSYKVYQEELGENIIHH